MLLAHNVSAPMTEVNSMIDALSDLPNITSVRCVNAVGNPMKKVLHIVIPNTLTPSEILSLGVVIGSMESSKIFS